MKSNVASFSFTTPVVTATATVITITTTLSQHPTPQLAAKRSLFGMNRMRRDSDVLDELDLESGCIGSFNKPLNYEAASPP